MGFFQNKIILLISPEKWGDMKISKHHYAIELSKRCKAVYFLNPPSSNIQKRFSIQKNEHFENLYIVTYRPSFNYKLRFHVRWLFDFLMRFQIKMLIKQIGQKIDIVWCFNPNIYTNLRLFSADVNIFHPVDQLNYDYQINVADSADVVFSVSEVILDKFRDKTVSTNLINHGLAEYFVEYCINANRNESKSRKGINIGYTGNLLIGGALDINAMREIIDDNPEVNFYFWGPASPDDSNLCGVDNEDTRELINFLKHKTNVVLKGVKHPKILAKEIQDMDGFLVCPDLKQDLNKGANAHKILEYLSTGKVIISNYISSYADKEGLIEMVSERSNERLPAMFKKIIKEIDYYNNMENRKKRIEFAKDNTYSKQIERIEGYLNEIVEKKQ